MAEENTDAKQDTDIQEGTEVEGAESSTDTEKMQPITDDDGFISTTEFEPVEKEPEEKVDTEAETSEETEQKTESEESEKKPYHEDPAWQRIIKERDEARAALKEKEEAAKTDFYKPENFNSQIEPTPEEKERNKMLDDFMALDDEELSDMMVNEPKKFRALTAMQLDREQTARARKEYEANQRRTREEREKSGLASFFKGREDGLELLQKGEIQKFMADNPEHNGISAYYELTSQARAEETQAKIDEAVKEATEKAIKETEEKIYKTLKAKGYAGSFASHSGNRTINDDTSAKVTHPEKFGGRRAVAIERAKARLAG